MTVITYKNFIHLSEDEKHLVLKWRNSDRVRKNMQNKDIIPLENHLRFVESLKTRKDCKYWLFMVDGVPVGVHDIVNLREDGTGGVVGSYIGDERYLGYGLLLIYLYIVKNENKLSTIAPKSKEDTYYVMKNNKRTYLMHKNIFGAKDYCEEDDRWYLYIDKDGWNSVKDNLKSTIYDPMNIERVDWVD